MLKRNLKYILIVVFSYLFLLFNNNISTLVVYNNDYNNKGNVINDIIGALEIPKIKVKNYLYSINSDNNDVSKNVEIINPSDMPNVNNGNLILAAHSGNSKIAYFKNLNRLLIGDVAIINYNDVNYIYKLTNTYSVKKNGSVEIIRDNNKTCLTLITCDKKDKNKQLVFIFELNNNKKLS